jgi:hypothetical protein
MSYEVFRNRSTMQKDVICDGVEIKSKIQENFSFSCNTYFKPKKNFPIFYLYSYWDHINGKWDIFEIKRLIFSFYI